MDLLALRRQSWKPCTLRGGPTWLTVNPSKPRTSIAMATRRCRGAGRSACWIRSSRVRCSPGSWARSARWATAQRGGRRPVARRRPLLHERSRHAEVARPGGQRCVDRVGPPRRHRFGLRGLGDQGDRPGDTRKDRPPIPRGWMAGRGRGRRLHGSLQCSQRRPTAVVPLSTRLRNRVRRRRR